MEAFNEHLANGTNCLPKASIIALEDETATEESTIPEAEFCVTPNPYDTLGSPSYDYSNHPSGILYSLSSGPTGFTSPWYTPFYDGPAYSNFAPPLEAFPLTTSSPPFRNWVQIVLSPHSPPPYDLDLYLEPEDPDL